MRSRRPLLAWGAALLLAASSAPATNTFQGFAEGEYVYVASFYAGMLESLAVVRGQQVTASAPLFRLERRPSRQRCRRPRRG